MHCQWIVNDLLVHANLLSWRSAMTSYPKEARRDTCYTHRCMQTYPNRLSCDDIRVNGQSMRLGKLLCHMVPRCSAIDYCVVCPCVPWMHTLTQPHKEKNLVTQINLSIFNPYLSCVNTCPCEQHKVHAELVFLAAVWRAGCDSGCSMLLCAGLKEFRNVSHAVWQISRRALCMDLYKSWCTIP